MSIADFHFDTDESDSEELSVPLITNVRTVTKADSPICISDTDTTPYISDPPPMKKFRITPNPSIKVGAPIRILQDQPSTSAENSRSTMAQIKSVWEVRMASLLRDKLIEHETKITSQLAVQDKNSASQSTSLEMLLRSRFDELETALKAKMDSFVAPKTDALESLINTKIDGLENFVNVKMNDMDTYVTTSIDLNDTIMIAKVDAVEARLTALVNPHLSDLDSDFGQ